MREKGQTEAAKTLETPVFSRGIEILTEKYEFIMILFPDFSIFSRYKDMKNYNFVTIISFLRR